MKKDSPDHLVAPPRQPLWRKALSLIAVFAVLLVAGYFARDYLKRLGPPERCWEIREEEGHLYKVNPCTGQFLLLGDVPGATSSP